ncbi:HNH endonuclease signature motif containing protein [Bifidobacterium sp. SO1]|uniref:HNH endonuclease n=1 Tax=Bifidobacterium sp. SO1 TaxID=2809029 RepID=UPI001BDCED82|nr:HNH endonuclease signature motif containing protein [Bifidobacterium sp. SO1]MBT1161255.1 HNH endonuclease [Bifidobacterium sp. SO1]
MADDMEIFAKFSARGYENPKLMTLALDHPSAYRVWTWAIMYAVRNLTDGFVPTSVAATTLAAKKRDLTVLEKSRFFEPVPGGWLIHDFHECQADRTRSELENRVPIPKRTRKRVYARDGYKCLRCGSTKNLTIDHIYPWSMGGRDDIDNFQTLCQSCNSWKHTKVIDFRKGHNNGSETH